MVATDERNALVVNVGHDGSRLSVVRRECVLLSRWSPIGGASFDRAVMEALQIDGPAAARLRRAWREAKGDPVTAMRRGDPEIDEAVRDAVHDSIALLASEACLALRTVSASRPGPAPDRIVIVGPEAGEPELERMLTNATGLPVHPGGAWAPWNGVHR